MNLYKLKNILPTLFILLTFSMHCTSPLVQSKIQPPIEELAPYAKIYTFCADETSQITTENATIITIPSNALVDSLGNIVLGEVDLHYLELLDIAEIFTSGIPMEVQDEMMSSGGMFDIQAYKNDKKLSLKADKKIDISMPSSQDTIAYPIWKYDKKNDEWLAQGESVLYAPNPEKEELNTLKQSLNPPLQIPLSNNNFSFNYNAIIDVHYGKYNSKATIDVQQKAASYGFTFSQFFVRSGIQYYGKNYPADFMLWENLSSKAIPHNGNNYNANLSKIENSINRYNLILYTKSDTAYEGSIRAVMPLEHLYRYSPENWAANYEKYKEEMEEVEATIEATKDFIVKAQIQYFGTYNYDYLIKNSSAKLLQASFLLPNGTKAEEVFYLINNQNAMVRYPERDWDKFRILNVADDIIVCIDKNRKAYTYYPNEQDYYQEDSAKTFHLTKSNVIINSVNDINLLFTDDLITKAF